jgi:hypothetical protein
MWRRLLVVLVLFSFAACASEQAATRDAPSVDEPAAREGVFGSWRARDDALNQVLITICPEGVGFVSRGQVTLDAKVPGGERWDPQTSTLYFGVHTREEGTVIDVIDPNVPLEQWPERRHSIWRARREGRDGLVLQGVRGAPVPAARLTAVDAPGDCPARTSGGEPLKRPTGHVVVRIDDRLHADGVVAPGDRLAETTESLELVVADTINNYGGLGGGIRLAAVDKRSQAVEEYFVVHQDFPDIAAAAHPGLAIRVSGWPSVRTPRPVGSPLDDAGVDELVTLLTAAHRGDRSRDDRLRTLLVQIGDTEVLRDDRLELLGPDASEAEREAQLLTVLFATRHFHRFLARADRALERWPNAWDVVVLRARGWFFMGQEDAARIALAQVIESLKGGFDGGALSRAQTYIYVDALFLLGALLLETRWMDDARRLDQGIAAWERYQEVASESAAREHVTKGLVALKARRSAAWR